MQRNTNKNDYKQLKSEMTNLMKEYERLRDLPPIKTKKMQIWDDADGRRFVELVESLSYLQNGMVKDLDYGCIKVYISPYDSVDEKYRSLKELSKKLLSFVEANIDKCSSTFLWYRHARETYEKCKTEIPKYLDALKELETIDEDYRGRKQKMADILAKIEKYES